MKIHAGLSVAEMAAIVSEAPISEGMQAVLSGGSVVTIYAGNEWESRDLDFVVDRVDRKRIAATLEGFGFQQESVRLFSHPNHTHWVDIVSWPVMVGEELVDKWATIDTTEGTLELLTPTQCAKDRLVAFYHSHDRQSLDQAVAVCVKHDVPLREIERWSEKERSPAKFQEFSEAVGRERAARKSSN